MNKYFIVFVLTSFLSVSLFSQKIDYLSVSPSGDFLMKNNGKPFFYMGDTGWLLMKKLNRKEANYYLDKRKEQGFNVIQIMVLHDANDVNVYNDKALVNGNIVTPYQTNGKDFKDHVQYDYWDNVEWVVDACAKRGMYVALVPLWGSVIKKTKPTKAMIRMYMNYLCHKISDRKNIIWLIGGDIRGDQFSDLWAEMADVIRFNNPNQLITFHPRGRTSSLDWFANEKWIDFHSVQSGHKNYSQDSTGYGEDSWRYIREKYEKNNLKPILDIEPVYEEIPKGLKDTICGRWSSDDIRRSAYWSVFAGGCGITYGHNSVMQFYSIGDRDANYFPTKEWEMALEAEGAKQMQYLKLLLEDRMENRRDLTSWVKNQGTRYDYIIGTGGEKFALFYTTKGNKIIIDKSRLEHRSYKTFWFNPRNGMRTEAKAIEDPKGWLFSPQGISKLGNDWVLEIVFGKK